MTSDLTVAHDPVLAHKAKRLQTALDYAGQIALLLDLDYPAPHPIREYLAELRAELRVARDATALRIREGI